MTKRIGIFSGIFDPVHGGHLAFALKAIQAASLDRVYFLPELKPRRKIHPTHFVHRLELIRIATKSYEKLEVLELPDRTFSAHKTLPRLRKIFPNDELWLLVGSDLAHYLPSWPHIDVLLSDMKLIVGMRPPDTPEKAQKYLKKLSTVPQNSYIITGQLNSVTSTGIRQALQANKTPHGLVASTQDYIKANWLYSTVSSDNL